MSFLLSIRRQISIIFSECRRTSSRSTPVQGPTEVCPPPETWIHGSWYTDPTLPVNWSTDWDEWDSIQQLWKQTVDGKLKIDKLKEVFDVPGTLEPLAYMRSCEVFFLFTAGERYYYFSDGHLFVHHMEFASP